MFKERVLASNIMKSIKQFPVLTITGPRQSGKTTLAKHLFPEYEYVSLEDPDMKEFALEDPRGFIQQYPKKTIIDEFQNVPKLTSYLQSHIDSINEPGMYILTGSNQFLMMENVSQSLAGRTKIVELLPFSFSEIFNDKTYSLEDVLFYGGYPRIFEMKIPPTDFYSSYFNTYIQKDIRSTINVRDLNLFQSFVRLCAARTGQVVNYNSFSNELGIDSKTAKRWVSILESGYIIKLVSPYYNNFNKRITKSYKMYFNDAGLAAYLLGIHDSSQLRNHPLKGELFETYVYSEIQKNILNNNTNANLFFFRDSNQKEIDFIIESGLSKKLVEVKLTSTPSKVNFKNLLSLAPYFGDNAERYLTYGGKDNKKMYNTQLVGFENIDKYL